jgi:cytochrome c-type biogenesis protein CcmH/NrfG
MPAVAVCETVYKSEVWHGTTKAMNEKTILGGPGEYDRQYAILRIQELKQRIGELNRQVNERDAKINHAIGQNSILAGLIAEVAESAIKYTLEGRYHSVQISESLWNTLLDTTGKPSNDSTSDSRFVKT